MRKKPSSPGERYICFHAIEGRILNQVCYRGFASMAALASISKDDPMRIGDQGVPEGVQRRRIAKHAREAYEYARTSSASDQPRLWPEVVLNVRDRSVVSVRGSKSVKGGLSFVQLRFDTSKLNAENAGVAVSRVDGNHRLYYAAGYRKTFAPLDVSCPFLITIGLTEEQELRVFADINDKQMGLQRALRTTQHAIIEGQDVLYSKAPAEWLVDKLLKEPTSPFRGLVDLGILKKRGEHYPIKRPALIRAHERLLSQWISRNDLTKEQQYKAVENFWNAVKNTWPGAWDETVYTPANRRYFLWRSQPSMYALGSLGGYLMTRLETKLQQASFEEFLKQISSEIPELWCQKVGGRVNPDSQLGGHTGSNSLFGKLEDVVKTLLRKKRKSNVQL